MDTDSRAGQRVFEGLFQCGVQNAYECQAGAWTRAVGGPVLGSYPNGERHVHDPMAQAVVLSCADAADADAGFVDTARM